MRETEIQNVFWNKTVIKAMLEGISRSSTTWPDITKENEIDDEDLNNPKWLYGPITTG